MPWLGSAQLHTVLTFNVSHHWVRVHTDPQLTRCQMEPTVLMVTDMGPITLLITSRKWHACQLTRIVRFARWASCCWYPEQELRVLSTRSRSLAPPLTCACSPPCCPFHSYVPPSPVCIYSPCSATDLAGPLVWVQPLLLNGGVAPHIPGST